MITQQGVEYNKYGLEDNQTQNRRKQKMEQKIRKHGVGDNKHGVEDNKSLTRR